MSLRDQLLAAFREEDAQKPRKISIKGWGEFYVREILATEVDTTDEKSAELAKASGVPVDKVRLARTAAQRICDESGELVFDQDSADDIKLLANRYWNRLRKALPDIDEGN